MELFSFKSLIIETDLIIIINVSPAWFPLQNLKAWTKKVVIAIRVWYCFRHCFRVRWCHFAEDFVFFFRESFCVWALLPYTVIPRYSVAFREIKIYLCYSKIYAILRFHPTSPCSLKHSKLDVAIYNVIVLLQLQICNFQNYLFVCFQHKSRNIKIVKYT